jgi:hypothetical protein
MGNDHRQPKDDSGLELNGKGRTAPEERVQETALAATLMVDLCYFEERSRSGNVFDLLKFFD